MYDYQLIALLLVLWTQPGDKTERFKVCRRPSSIVRCRRRPSVPIELPRKFISVLCIVHNE